MTTKPFKSAAVLTFFGPSNYSDEGVKDIVAWLHKQIRMIKSKKQRATLAKRYTARYLYK